MFRTRKTKEARDDNVDKNEHSEWIVRTRQDMGKEERWKEREDLQFSEGVSSLSAYTHHSECSLWEHKSVDENEKKQSKQQKKNRKDSSGKDQQTTLLCVDNNHRKCN